MRSFAKLAVVGFSGVVLFKLFVSIFLPLIGLLIGLTSFAVKLAVIVAVGYFVWGLVKKRDGNGDLEVGNVADLDDDAGVGRAR